MKKCKGKNKVKTVYRGDCNNCGKKRKCKLYHNMHYNRYYEENVDISEIELLKDWD